MTLKELIADAAEIFGTDAPEESKEYGFLFRCANLAVSEMACAYIDCTASQTFDVTGGKIDYSKFSKTFLKVKSVKKGGREVPYELFINYLKVPNGRIEVIYGCIPKFTSGNEDIMTVCGINESVLFYAVLVQYAAVNGMPEIADMWSKKLESALFGAIKTGRTKKIPAGFAR